MGQIFSPDALEDRDESTSSAGARGTLPVMTYRDMGAHNSADSAFIAYDGIVYDITAFLDAHPGGRSILLPALGTDVTDTLESFHSPWVSRMLRTSANRIARIRAVARLDPTTQGGNYLGLHAYQSRRRYPRVDALAAELRSEVLGYLGRAGLPAKKPFADCLVLLTFFYAAYGLCLYMAFIEGAALACALLGPIATFMAVNVGHAVMHGSFSESRFMNLLGRTLWDFGGYSSRCWDIEHQGHHQAPHTSIDVQTAGASVVRFFEHQEHRWYHRYQIYYIWIVLIFYSPSSWVTHSYKTLFTYNCIPLGEKILHVAAKTVFVLAIALSFHLFDAAAAATNLFIFMVSMSYFALFTLFIQHEDSYLPEDQAESWSVRQIGTSATWNTRNALFEWLFGYFNYHTEHHLFPGLNPSLYPRIQPIVRAVCERHGVAYKHISYFELVRSQVRAWRKFAAGPGNVELSHR